MELILTGSPVTAAEAERIGLVNRVVPAADLIGRSETDRERPCGASSGRHRLHHQRNQSRSGDAVRARLCVRGDALWSVVLDRRHARGHACVSREAEADLPRTVAVAPTTIDGTQSGAGRRFAIVVSKYHDFVTGRLEAGALAALDASGVRAEDVTVVRVPGAFELPTAARLAANDAPVRCGRVSGLPDPRCDAAF